MPRDFLSGDYGAPKQEQSSGRDFLQEPEQESLGTAAALAIPRLGKDLYQGAYNMFQQSPEYYEAAKTEVPGVLNPLNFHPIDRAKQALAGLLELGQGINHAPRNFAQYAANRLHLIPQEWANKIPVAPDLDEDIEKYLGSPQRPGDALVRGIARNTLNIMPAAKIASALNPLNLTTKNIAKDILRTGEKNKQIYGNLYQNLWKDAEGQGFGDSLYNVDIDMPVLKKYSPGKSIKGIIDFDENPTLANAHAAKSDLLRIKRELDKKTTLATAERQQLKAANNAIDSIKKNMFKDSLGKVNQSMLDRYEKIQKGYANEVIPYKNKAINEFKRGESSPKELVNSLSKKAFYAKRGKDHNALRIRKMINSHPNLARIGTGSALGAGALGLYNELFGNNK